jgi:hypothetical protein
MKLNEKMLKKYIRQLVLKELYEQDEKENSDSNVVEEIQNLINQNQYLKGQTVNEEDLIENEDYVLFASEDSANHIKERHSDPSKPGSTFEASLNLRGVMEDLLSTTPSQDTGSMVKWLGVDVGSTIGGMGVAHASPEEVEEMEDYQMPEGRREMVKLKRGEERQPTSEVSLITAKLGDLSNGKTALSLVSMFPGGMTVDRVTIPSDRAAFAKAGFYFAIPGSSEQSNTEEKSSLQESGESDTGYGEFGNLSWEEFVKTVEDNEKERNANNRRSPHPIHNPKNGPGPDEDQGNGYDAYGRPVGVYEAVNVKRWQKLAGIIKG